jgi:hypothetical protein
VPTSGAVRQRAPGPSCQSDPTERCGSLLNETTLQRANRLVTRIRVALALNTINLWKGTQMADVFSSEKKYVMQTAKMTLFFLLPQIQQKIVI